VSFNEERNDILNKVKKLVDLYKAGALGGEKMPEDSNPHLARSSNENLLYFTLPMALNYQRNSYKLWEAALKTWEDDTTKAVFFPDKVLQMSDEELSEKLTKHKVALQPNKQPSIWRKLCQTFQKDFEGSVKNFFERFDFDIKLAKEYIMKNKKDFPYLSGTKILNYWLYVMTQQSEFSYKNRSEISVAPDTHVLQASLKLGVLTVDEMKRSNARNIVSQRWEEILKGTEFEPIDIHTPFWLWSRNGFEVEI